MSKSCPMCGKTSLVGGKRKLLRGKYNPVKTVRRYPNLQWAKLPSGGRIKICTSCLKKNKHISYKQ